jgi:hypothetical protein
LNADILKKILRENAMTTTNIRAKRVTAGIAGYAVCQVAGISRARLSDIERAEQAGLSLTGVRL